jgi:uracil-DNA glycosylase
VIRPVDVLLEFLEAEQTRGVTHVHLDQGARDGLRELFERSRPGPKSAVTPPPVPAAESASAPAVSAPASLPAVALKLEPAGSSKIDKLAALRRQAENWTPSRTLGTLREKMVFSTGNPDSRVMFIGEAPGYHEEREGEPFVGPAGQKLNDILKAMGLSRSEVYLSTIVKFRPATARQTTNNRPATADELTSGMPIVRAEIEIVQPSCIVALGETTAQGLLGQSGTIATLRDAWHSFEGIPVRITYHPSYLLQTGGSSTQTKRFLWEDMLAVMENLSLPISDKQRGFFLPKA